MKTQLRTTPVSNAAGPTSSPGRTVLLTDRQAGSDAPVNTSSCCAPLAADTLAAPDAVALASAFAALADPVRLRLLNLIATAPTGEACACDLVHPVGKSQPTVSHHLKILVDAQLVTREKRGVWAWYRARPDKLTELRAFLS